ncbi:conserved hypothetical protein, partial [Ixodes scapularis]
STNVVITARKAYRFRKHSTRSRLMRRTRQTYLDTTETNISEFNSSTNEDGVGNEIVKTSTSIKTTQGGSTATQNMLLKKTPTVKKTMKSSRNVLTAVTPASTQRTPSKASVTFAYFISRTTPRTSLIPIVNSIKVATKNPQPAPTTAVIKVSPKATDTTLAITTHKPTTAEFTDRATTKSVTHKVSAGKVTHKASTKKVTQQASFKKIKNEASTKVTSNVNPKDIKNKVATKAVDKLIHKATSKLVYKTTRKPIKQAHKNATPKPNAKVTLKATSKPTAKVTLKAASKLTTKNNPKASTIMTTTT